MNDRILFIVYNGEIKFLQNSTMDHREWYISLGGNMDEYDETIRGYVMEGKLIFFKANLNYDSEVIDFATKMAIPIKKQLNLPDLKVCCGINPGHDSVKWEPILTLKDENLDGYEKPAKEIPELAEDIILQRQEQAAENAIQALPEMPEQLELQKQKELEEQKRLEEQKAATTPTEPIIEFKNDLNDPVFIKKAVKFTITMMVVAIIAKVIVFNTQKTFTDSRWNMLLVFVQMGGFLFTIIGYNQKLNKSRYFALASSLASIFLFDFIDIVVGALNLLFTVDHTYIQKIKEFIQYASKKAKEFINSKKQKK